MVSYLVGSTDGNKGRVHMPTDKVQMQAGAFLDHKRPMTEAKELVLVSNGRSIWPALSPHYLEAGV